MSIKTYAYDSSKLNLSYLTPGAIARISGVDRSPVIEIENEILSLMSRGLVIDALIKCVGVGGDNLILEIEGTLIAVSKDTLKYFMIDRYTMLYDYQRSL